MKQNKEDVLAYLIDLVLEKGSMVTRTECTDRPGAAFSYTDIRDTLGSWNKVTQAVGEYVEFDRFLNVVSDESLEEDSSEEEDETFEEDTE